MVISKIVKKFWQKVFFDPSQKINPRSKFTMFSYIQYIRSFTNQTSKKCILACWSKNSFGDFGVPVGCKSILIDKNPY